MLKIKGNIVPTNYQEAIEHYGNPLTPEGKIDQDWYDKNIVLMQCPYPVYVGIEDEKTNHIIVHRLVVPSLTRVLRSIKDVVRSQANSQLGYFCDEQVHKAKLLELLSEYGVNTIGQTFKITRSPDGKHIPSAHDFGAAIDLDPYSNVKGRCILPDWVISIFENEGWYWHGFAANKDTSHFQLVRGL